MTDNKLDWEFGQALIELGHATLDQVREAITIQERMKAMGVVPKPLRDILVEKGYVSPAQADAAMRKSGKSTRAASGYSIPGYELLERIGKGAMGLVFRARQLSLDRIVAVKVLAPKFAQNPEFIRRFMSEARAVARLQHPNIVAGVDVGEAGGTYYFVMEFVEGRTVREMLSARGSLPEREALDIAVQVARALDHASRNKIVHRDVKPENIMILPDGIAKLCDLGLAREMSGEPGVERRGFGTPNYVSPEQVRGLTDIDVRADLYSLGASLYHMLAGATPFRAVTPEEMLEKHLSDPVVPPHKVRAGISEGASALVCRLMEKDRARRPANALEVVQEIERVLSAQRKVPAAAPEPPTPPTPKAPVSRRAVAARSSSFAFVFIGAVVLAIGGVFVFKDGIFPSGETSTTDKTKPKPVEDGKPAATDKEAEEELDQLKILQENDPDFDRVEEVVKRLQDYQKKYAGKKWEGYAATQLRDYLRRLEEFAQAQLVELRRKEQEPRAAGQWAEVLRLYLAFPQKFLKYTDTGRSVSDEIVVLRNRIRETYARAKADIEGLLRAEKYGEAMALLKELEKTVTAEQAADLAALRERVTKIYEEKVGAVRKAVEDRYLEIDGPFKEAMRKRDARAAAEIVKRFFLRDWKEQERPFVTVEGMNYAVLKGLIDGWQVEQIAKLCEDAAGDPEDPSQLGPGRGALLDLRNAAALEIFLGEARAGIEKAAAAKSKEKWQLVTFDKHPGFFERRNNSLIFLIENERIVPLDPVATLQGEDMVAMAARSMDDDREKSQKKFDESAGAQARAGLFYYYSGNALTIGKAEEHLSRSVKLGAKGTRVYVASIVATVNARIEAELRGKVDKAVALMKEKKFAAAKPILEELLATTHPFVTANKSDLERMLAEANAGLGESERLAAEYKGKVEFAPGGLLKVTYDFENRDQAALFEPVTKEGTRTFVGRWKIDKGGLESGTDTSVARWKHKVKGDVELEYDLTAIEDPQNIVINVYFNEGKRTHYAVVFGFDWVGRAHGDTDNTAEDRNGMPRTCVIKHPVEADIQRWVLPGPWENWKARLVGKSQMDYKLAKGKKVRVKFERKGGKVRLFADASFVWEGEDAEYSEGSLLFFSDCRARIDNLTITFKPSK